MWQPFTYRAIERAGLSSFSKGGRDGFSLFLIDQPFLNIEFSMSHWLIFGPLWFIKPAYEYF